MFFYQIPFIPELLFKANDFSIFRQLFCAKPMGIINPNNMTPDDLEVFKYTFSQKGTYMYYLMFIYDSFTNSGTTKAAINYYRGLFIYQNNELFARITVPVLIVWGCQDGAIGEELADASQKY